MAEFLKMLKNRREAARQRLEEARQSVVDAEDVLRKWDDAIRLELHSPGSGGASRNGRVAEPAFTLTLESVRTKRDILRNALRTAPGPLKPIEIFGMVRPVMSRASVYLLLGQMKEDGEVEEVDRKFILRSLKESSPNQ